MYSNSFTDTHLHRFAITPIITKRLKNYWFVTWYGYRLAWLHFTSVLETLSQRNELERLIRWAHRKKLKGVREHYQRLLGDVEMRLLNKAVRYPHLTELTDWIYCAQVMLCLTPRFYPKGAAAKYSLRK